MATRARRWIWPLAVAGLVAACGGDDPSGDATTEAPASSTDGDAEADPSVPTSGSDDGSSAPADAAPGWAGALTVAGREPPTFDPARLTTEASHNWDVQAAVYDTLLRWTADGTYTPQLAESFESDDGVTWVLGLRDGVTFSDGTPLDATAVLFNLERQLDPANAFGGQGSLAQVTSMEAVDDLTVELVLEQPNGSFWEHFVGIGGMMASPTAAADPESLGRNPVGAGPYLLDDYVPDSYVELVRNPDYWDPTKPAYESVRVEMIPDPLARAAAVTAHEVDLMHAAAPEALIAVGDPSSHGLYVNRADGAMFVAFNHSRGIAQDIRVREAVTIAFDPERVRDAVLGGTWEELAMVCPPFNTEQEECRPGIWPQADPERARELIADYAAEGNSVDVTLLAGDGQVAQAEFIQQTLNDIGLNVTLDIRPGAEWSPLAASGDFEMSWYAHAQPVQPRLWYQFASDQRNLLSIDIPEYDEAVRTARFSIDADERADAWTRVQELLAEHFMAAFYAPYLDGYVVSDGIDVGDQFRTVHLHYSEVRPAGQS